MRCSSAPAAEFALQFVDRQQVVRELTLDRDVGVMLSSTNLFGLSETYAAGTTNYAHAAADVVFKYAGFSLLSEFVWRRANKALVSNGTLNETTRSGYGYLVQAGYLPIPKLEVVARWEQLFALRITDPKLVDLAVLQGRQLGGGVNLYLNNHIFKIQADYFHTFGSAGPVRDQVRLQLDASF
ncbi:MAG: hypothetical protein ACT4TC_21125 [Myxococcaceae bacterium]